MTNEEKLREAALAIYENAMELQHIAHNWNNKLYQKEVCFQFLDTTARLIISEAESVKSLAYILKTTDSVKANGEGIHG